MRHISNPAIAALPAAVAIAVAVVAGAAPALTGHQQTGVGRILLATVLGPGDAPIVNLEADDFVVEENGQARDVLSVHVADYPVVLLIDPAHADAAVIRLAAARFVRRLGSDRAVAVEALTEPSLVIAEFDDDRATVLARLESVVPEGARRLAPFDALAHAASTAETRGAPFSALVVAWNPPETDEPDAGSAAAFGRIFDSRAVVHVVSRGAPLGPPRPYDRLMRDLAARTGGQFTAVYSAGSYAVALDRVADRLAAEMMVEILVPAARPADPSVRVGVRIPGARVLGLRVSR